MQDTTVRLIALTVVWLATGIGLWLHFLVFGFPLPPAGGIFLIGLVLALATVGWFCTQALSPLWGLVVAPLAPFVLFGVMLVAKQLRYPSVPLTGDGFVEGVLIYAAVSLSAAGAGVFGPLKAGSFRGALVAASILIAVATLVAAIPYLLGVA